jgi:hypothetical protein
VVPKLCCLRKEPVPDAPMRAGVAPTGTGRSRRPSGRNTGLTCRPVSTVEPQRSPERRLERKRCLLAPSPRWWTTHHGGVPVPMTQRPNEVIEITGEQNGITMNPVTQWVEAGKDRGALATCAHTLRRRSERRHRRVTTPSTSALAKRCEHQLGGSR